MENNVQQPQAAQVPENLTPQQALGLLIQGVHFAQSKGVYTLKDAALLDKAVSVFATEQKPEAAATTATAETATAEPTKA